MGDPSRAREHAPARGAVTHVERTGPVAVTAPQAGLLRWIAVRPSCATLNLSCCVKVVGPLDIDALVRAVQRVVARHEALRTRFVIVDDEGFQHIDSDRPPPDIIDLRHLDPISAGAEADRVFAEDAHRHLDLAQEVSARWTILRVGEESTRLVLTIHQIACGFVDIVTIILPEIVAAYDDDVQKRVSPPRRESLQYADFATWSSDWLKGEGAALVERCRQRFAGALPLELPVDGPRTTPIPLEAETVNFELPADVVAPFDALCDERRIPVAALITSALALSLARRCRQSDVVIGLVSDMHTVRPELGGIVGRFLNPIPCRIDLGGSPTALELVMRGRASLLESHRYRIVPGEIALDVPSAMDSPLMRVMANIISSPPGETLRSFHGTSLSLDWIQLDECKNEVVLSIERASPTLWRGYVRAAKPIYRRATVERMAKELVDCVWELVKGAPEDRRVDVGPFRET